MSQALDKYEAALLSGWEEVYKKGQLTMWIMLALKAGPKHMAEIKLFIDEATNCVLNADDQSMYRALRRYYDAEMVDFASEAGDSGPDRKVYRLTDIGRGVLAEFLDRNIINVLFKPSVQQLIMKEER